MTGRDVTPPERPTQLPEQFIIFLDFLGFSEAAKAWDVERVLPLLDLLIRIAASKSTFSVDGDLQEDGSYKIKIVPEITTFSDHIVASYHLFDQTIEGAEVLLPLWLNHCISEAQRIVCWVALEALRMGSLHESALSVRHLGRSTFTGPLPNRRSRPTAAVRLHR
jgi:hypothetical protein